MSTDQLVPVRVAAGHLLARDLRRIRRYPTTTLRILCFPVFFIIVVTSTFGSAGDLSGFPTHSLLDWVLPTGFVAAAVSAATIAVFAVARDLESGFFDRLLLSPVRPMALVVAPLSAAVARALVPFTIVVALGLLAGVGLPGGLFGLVPALVAAEGSAFCAAAWGIGIAFRVASVRKTIGPVQLVNMSVLYLSTAQAPLLLLTGWLRFVARLNPMTQVLALGRQGFIGPVTWGHSWPGLLVLAVGGGLLSIFARRGLKRLLRS